MLKCKVTYSRLFRNAGKGKNINASKKIHIPVPAEVLNAVLCDQRNDLHAAVNFSLAERRIPEL